MPNNHLSGNYDPKAWVHAFEQMDPKIRRWAFISAKMAEKHKTFSDISRPNGRPTSWFISAAAQGKENMTERVVKALEVELDIDLTPFLSVEEARKCGKRIMPVEPREEAV